MIHNPTITGLTKQSCQIIKIITASNHFIQRYCNMKNVTSFIIIFLCSLNGFAQGISNSLGVITIDDNYSADELTISFFNSDGSVWWKLDFFSEVFPNNQNLSILAFKPDYFLFKAKCVKEEKNTYDIIVNEVTGLTKTIQKSPALKLQSWKDYVLNVFAIGFKSNQQAIYKTIEGQLLETNHPTPLSIIQPREIKGDWMRIIWRKNDDYPEESKQHYSGWIKWKEKDKILIRLFHLS